ncbi:methyltransferase [Nocardiopsis baichengensis]|uniref:methyltransferase n=1 Tax=Nocardiopsis baichengensis TaxID=280240 RepID=UPI000346E9B0|nr:methyltransferase [Nocardiopsis baichengensis]
MTGPADLWDMADLLTPMAVRTAATLRLADHMAQGARTAPELARACGADTDALGRLLAHLVRVGVVDRDAQGRHRTRGEGERLRSDHPDSLRAELDLEEHLPRAELALTELVHSVRTGGAAFPERFGRGFWEVLADDPERAQVYDRRMGTDVAKDAEAIAAAYDWGALGGVADVGGGDGTLLAALLRAHPGLRGAVVDRPDTARRARSLLREAGFGDRAGAVAADFFSPLPRGYGGYLLSAVVHDWDRASAVEILRRCAEAAAPQGRVLVAENTGADGESPDTALDLRMLAFFGGKDRGVGELRELGEEAGLRTVGVHPAGRISVVEMAPAGRV